MDESLKTAEPALNGAPEARRAFLNKAARLALAAPLTTSLILAADIKPALATGHYGKPGHKPRHKGPKHKGKWGKGGGKGGRHGKH